MGKRTNEAKWLETQKRWQIKVQKDGQRRTFTSSISGRTGKREAHRKADEWLDEGIDRSSHKVKDLYAAFIEDQKLKTGTANVINLESIGKNWIAPYYGSKRICDVTEHDIQNPINAAQSRGLSKKTQQNILAAEKAFIKFCRMNKWTKLLPEDVGVPESARYKGKQILEPHDIIRLFNCDMVTMRGRRVIEEYINAFRLAVLSGFRPGELRGLTWNDVTANYIDVRRSINKWNEETRGKNENALRRHWLTEMEKKVLEDQKELSPPHLSTYVFNISSTDNFRKHWKRYAEENGITSITPYEMRHTFVSATHGLPDGMIKKIVGHSKNMDTYGVYGHDFEGAGEETAKAVAGIFEKILKQENE